MPTTTELNPAHAQALEALRETRDELERLRVVVEKYLDEQITAGNFSIALSSPVALALEYAYENVLNEARHAIKGMRRPAALARTRGES